MINVLADKNIFQIEQFLPPETHLTLFDPNNGLPDDAGRYSALLIRTVTKINKQTLPSIKNLKFIGTASSGTDHVDIPYLESLGITFAPAAGCNARAVAEYIITALLIWSEARSVDITQLSVGIIGVGHVGSEVRDLLSKFSIKTICYDPPRAIREPGFQSSTLEEVLNVDILTFHVPLNKSGEYATWHWLDEKKLQGRKYPLIINASRGGVIDENALLKYYEEDDISDFILDVWENEPDFSTTIAEKACIATPHIAGYSYQAKQNATRMICKSLSKHFGFSMSESSDLQKCQEISNLNEEDQSLSQILETIHPILEYDRSLRKLCHLPAEQKIIAFRKLRTDHPYRMEYSQIQISPRIIEHHPVLKKLGIQSLA